MKYRIYDDQADRIVTYEPLDQRKIAQATRNLDIFVGFLIITATAACFFLGN